MNRLKQLHWPLITSMGSLALIWPFMNLTGLMDRLGRPSAAVTLLTIISGVWLAIVLLTRVRQPFLTLLFTGVAYQVFALLIRIILSPVEAEAQPNPLVYPFVIVGMLSYGAAWGAFMGGIAWGIRHVFGAGFTKYQPHE